eukprot:jgi/Mesen1/7871/ME000042S07308
MGDFLGKVLPGVLFLSIGIWHLLCSTYKYVKSPSAFESQVWHPVSSKSSFLRHLELYVIMTASALIIFYELGPAASFQPLDNGAIPLPLLPGYERACVVFLFFLYASAVLISEKTSLLPLPPGSGHVLLAVTFACQLILVHFHPVMAEELEAPANTLLSYAIGVTVLSLVLLLWYPKSILLDIVAGAGITLQGTWLLQVAFSLYMEGAIPTGCKVMPNLPDGRHGPTSCTNMESKHRAMGIMNLLFNVHLIGVVLFSLVLRGTVFKCCAPAEGYGELELETPNFRSDLHQGVVLEDDLED